MKPAILLIDLQNDYLRNPSLEPAAGQIVERAELLLNVGRAFLIPIVHVWTTVNPPGEAPDLRMPHWKRTGLWSCVAGTEGHATPPVLQPLSSEPIIHKRFFSAFENAELDALLKSLQVDTLIFAGVHLHACIRASALDAYRRGFEVLIAEDAVGSDDPLHAAITRRYLEKRAARFIGVEAFLSSQPLDSEAEARGAEPGEAKTSSLPGAIIADQDLYPRGLEQIVHVSPRQDRADLWSVPICGEAQVREAASSAKAAWRQWRNAPLDARVGVLRRLAEGLEAELEPLARQMAVEIGKPITQGRAEVRRAVALLATVTSYENEPGEIPCTVDSMVRYRPLGVVAAITPWNNPVAIPIGKIGAALFYGNAVVWKPAPPGSGLAAKMLELLGRAECPAGVVNLVCGDRSTALALMADPQVDAVTLSGSVAAGYAAQEICARRHIPLQAELGGNNAAIVWGDCDLEDAAGRVAEAAFGFAGQRCTANRRVIVEARCYDAFVQGLQEATAKLKWGDPVRDDTQVGPLISLRSCARVEELVERAGKSAEDVLTPHRTLDSNYYRAAGIQFGVGAYFYPTVICNPDPQHEIVQEETFGPVLVVQRAEDWGHALQLCNGVRQGLVAALFSHSPELQRQFLQEAEAGILKINSATADANAEAPFGGWKVSGLGPPEHGIGNRAFYTRLQSVYRAESSEA